MVGAPLTDRLRSVDPDRDTTEIALARWAIAELEPFLGTCRGLQILDVATGGSLIQDLASVALGAR